MSFYQDFFIPLAIGILVYLSLRSCSQDPKQAATQYSLPEAPPLVAHESGLRRFSF
jgi:hypothetical protein